MRCRCASDSRIACARAVLCPSYTVPSVPASSSLQAELQKLQLLAQFWPCQIRKFAIEQHKNFVTEFVRLCDAGCVVKVTAASSIHCCEICIMSGEHVPI